MQKPKSSEGVLIVVELGAEWPSVPELRESAAGRRVLAQDEGETPGAFGARVGQQLDGLFARAVPLTTAFVACNERLDDAAQRARAEIARSALGAMAKLGRGSLLLPTSERSSGRLRRALASLATELTQEWQRAGVRTAVVFADERAGRKSSDMPARVSARRAKDGARKVA